MKPTPRYRWSTTINIPNPSLSTVTGTITSGTQYPPPPARLDEISPLSAICYSMPNRNWISTDIHEVLARLEIRCWCAFAVGDFHNGVVCHCDVIPRLWSCMGWSILFLYMTMVVQGEICTSVGGSKGLDLLEGVQLRAPRTDEWAVVKDAL